MKMTNMKTLHFKRGGFLVSMLHSRESHISVQNKTVSIKDFSS
jgi:hypothetical protein